MSCREEDLRVWSGLLPVPREGPQLCLLFLVFCSDPPVPGEISCSALLGSCSTHRQRAVRWGSSAPWGWEGFQGSFWSNSKAILLEASPSAPRGASTRRFSASAEAKWTCKKERMVVLGTRVLCDSDKHFPLGNQALEGLDQNHWDSNRPTSLRLPSLTKIPHHLQLLPDEQVTAICIQTGNGGALALSISHHHSSPGSPESQEGMLGAWRTHLTAGASTSLTLSRGRDPRTVFG